MKKSDDLYEILYDGRKPWIREKQTNTGIQGARSVMFSDRYQESLPPSGYAASVGLVCILSTPPRFDDICVTAQTRILTARPRHSNLSKAHMKYYRTQTNALLTIDTAWEVSMAPPASETMTATA